MAQTRLNLVMGECVKSETQAHHECGKRQTQTGNQPEQKWIRRISDYE